MARRSDPSNPQRERYGGDAGRALRDGPSDDWTHRSGNGDAGRVTHEPESIEQIVERLSRHVGEATDAESVDDADIRTFARELVREDTAPTGPPQPTRRARLSFFAVALWLAVAGAVLSFLVPPAGVVCFFMAGIAAIVAAILGPGEAPPDRTANSGEPWP